MPHQNRVTPFSEIIATPARGQWIGNRGIIHDDTGRIRRLYQCRRWIVCMLDFKGRRRRILQPGHWTELFFLDEATAFAAGHRPCAYCQRARYEEFRATWAAANPDLISGPKPGADEMDLCIHRQRLDASRNRITYSAPLDTLPAGTFVVHEGAACLVKDNRLFRWRPDGYTPCAAMSEEATVEVLTPRSIVKTMGAGFRAQIDGSAGVG